MRILCTESFAKIVPLTRENYGNLHARLLLKMKPEHGAVFASFTHLASTNSGQWSVNRDDEDLLQPLSVATPEQRDMVAVALRNTEAALRKALGQQADLASKLMYVPDEDSVWWVENTDGSISPILTRWGFRRLRAPEATGVIELLINRAQELEIVDVDVELRYTDGAPVADTDVEFHIFGNSVMLHSDANGALQLGKVTAGKDFSATLPDGTSSAKMEVLPGVSHYVLEFYRPVVEEAREEVVVPPVEEKPQPPEVQIPEPPQPEPQPAPAVRLRVLDNKRRPLANTAVKIRCRKGYLDTITDAQGYVTSLTRADLEPGEKPIVEVWLPKKSRKMRNVPLNQQPVQPPILPTKQPPVQPLNNQKK